MVGGVSAAWAARDAFFAAGLGFLLCLGYSAARFVLGASRTACAVCDALALALGAVAYRSAAAGRFYAGVPRWYTLAACALAFLACRAALAPLLERARLLVWACVRWPFARLHAKVMRPLAGALAQKRADMREKKTKKGKNAAARQKKRLQNTGPVLYNSK